MAVRPVQTRHVRGEEERTARVRVTHTCRGERTKRDRQHVLVRLQCSAGKVAVQSVDMNI